VAAVCAGMRARANEYARSGSNAIPVPSAITPKPIQIQLTKGLWCSRTAQAVALTGSPSEV